MRNLDTATCQSGAATEQLRLHDSPHEECGTWCSAKEATAHCSWCKRGSAVDTCTPATRTGCACRPPPFAGAHSYPSSPQATRPCTQVPRVLLLHADRSADARLRQRWRRHGGVRGGCAAAVAVERRPRLSHRGEPRPVQGGV
jgi:hypothetical protein